MPKPAKSWHQRSCMPWLFRLVRVHPGWVKQPVLKWILVGPTGRMTLSWEKGDLARTITLPAGPTFCCSCKQFATFVRKCRKSWLPQGSSGWRVILLFGTSFLRINKTFLYVLNYYWVIFWLFFRRIFVSCFACWNQISTRTCCSKTPLWTCRFAIDSFFSHSNENSLTKKC